MKTLSCLALALMLTAASAFAAEKPLLPPDTSKKTAKSKVDWSGVYVGAHGGVTSGTSKWTGAATTGTTSTFGAHAGYNYQFGNGVVFGSETSVSH